MNRLHGHTRGPRVVASREHDAGGADTDVVHTVAADHPTRRASLLLGLVIETAEGPVYANHHGQVLGPFADAADALDHLATLHATTTSTPAAHAA